MARGNVCVRYGFLAHVTGDHALETGERTLFFRFDDQRLHAAEERAKMSKEEVARKEHEAIRVMLERLANGAEEARADLAEVMTRIVVLEQEVRALAMAMALCLLALALAVLLGSRFAAAMLAVAAGAWLVNVARAAGLCSEDNPLEAFVGLQAGLLSRVGSPPSMSMQMSVPSPAPTTLAEERAGKAPPPTLPAATADTQSDARGAPSEVLPRVYSLSARWGARTAVPPPAEWPSRPVLLCVNSVIPGMVTTEHGSGPLPIGVPIPFESELFVGTLLVRLKGVPSDDPSGDAAYFMGRKRLFQAIVQGRFKEDIAVSDVVTGHEFTKPLRRLPPSWVVSAGSAFIRRLAPGARIELAGKSARVLALLGATSQTLSVEAPGMEPDIRSDVREESTLLGGAFRGGSVSARKRKRLLSDPRWASTVAYTTEPIYTFDFYQHLLDAKEYRLDLGFTTISLAPSLNGQPIQIMAKALDGRYLWSFQLWHEKLL